MNELIPGTHLGKYALEEFLGQGGMGQVWRARHSLLANREVAIKVLLPGPALLGDSVKRFLREASILSDLGGHPHIVQIYDIDMLAKDQYYLVMEYVPNSLAREIGEVEVGDGGTLDAVEAVSRRLSVAEAVRIAREICLGLQAAHAKGVIHRDLKPANVLLAAEGTVKLCDFGIARVAGAATLTSMGMGTPFYTATEVLRGDAHQADERADIYSVGAMLYRMVTGEVPQGFPERPGEVNPEVTEALEEVILKCMKKRPEDRYDSVDEVLSALADAQGPVKPVSPQIVAGAAGSGSVEARSAGGMAVPPDLLEEWEAHEAHLRSLGFEIPGDVPLVIRNEVDHGIAVWIPPGAFQMGSEDYRDEKPVHTVHVDGFYMDVYPVTNAQFAGFLNEKGNKKEGGVGWMRIDSDAGIKERTGRFTARPGYENHPVVQVSWYGARAYCAWAGKRLPAEAEWEYACRGTDGRVYPWGEEQPDEELANFGGKVDGTTEVGAYPKGMSPFGLCDMGGNVWEWCADWYDKKYYRKSPTRNPKGPKSGRYRVLRGGSWLNNPSRVRCANRYRNNPVNRDYDNGFRCAR